MCIRDRYDKDGTLNKHKEYVVIDNRPQNEIYEVGRYNLLGQEVSEDAGGVQIIYYSDGSTVKVYKD